MSGPDGARRLVAALLVMTLAAACSAPPVAPTVTRLASAPEPTRDATTVVPTHLPQPTATPTTVPLARPTPVASPSRTSAAAPTAGVTSPSASFAITSYALERVAGVGRSPEAIAVLGGRVAIACASTGNVCMLSSGSMVGCIDVGGRPTALAAGAAGERLYVLDEATETVHVIEGDRIVALWPVPGARSLALAGERLFVGTESAQVMLMSARDGAPLGKVAMAASNSAVVSLAISADGGRLYAGTYGMLHAVEVAQGIETAHVALNGSYRTLAVSPDGSRVYAAEYDSAALRANLVALAGDTLEVLGRVPAPADPAAATVDPRDGRVYLASASAGLLVSYDAGLTELGRTAVGLSPRSLALDPATRVLYVANADADNVHIVDVDADPPRVMDTIATAGRYASIAWDEEQGRLLVAAATADRILVRSADGTVTSWDLRGYPVEVLPLPAEGRVAALTRQPPRLWLLSTQGEVMGSFPIAPGSGGLYYRAAARSLYAGSLRLDLQSGRTEGVMVPGAYGLGQPPRAYLRDTVRGRMYAIALNGLPGSNGGTVLAPLDGDVRSETLGGPGVIEAAYDAVTDRFLVANGPGLGPCSLQALSAVDGEELLDTVPGGCPTHLALMPTTGHLWVSVSSERGAAPPDGRAVALEAGTFRTIAEVPLDGAADSMTIDALSGRVLLGIGAQGRIVMVQDGAAPAAPAPGITPTWTPLPAPTPAGSATAPPG